MEVSLQHITNELENFSKEHLYLNSFHAKQVDDFNADNLIYPLFWFMPDGMEIRQGEITFNLSCMVLDRSTGVQATKMLSDTALVIEDITTLMNDNIDEYGFNVEVVNTSIKPVLDSLGGDTVTGWKFILKAKVGSSLNENVVAR